MRRLLCRTPRPVDTENQIELRSRSYLDRYQIELNPSPPFSVRVKEFYQICMQSLKLPPDVQKTIFAIILNIICAVYQTVDAYRVLFPGSKAAANIYHNESTLKAWNAFFWIIAFATTAANLRVSGIWSISVYNGLRLEGLVRRILRFEFLISIFWSLMLIIVLPVLLVSPMWFVFVYRLIWETVAWKHECGGWDYTVLLDPVDWDSFLPNASFVGMATILGSNGNFQMQLLRNIQTHDVYTFDLLENLNSTFLLSSIAYNLTSLTYTVGNITAPFNITPTLSFPSLKVDTRDPSIPFLRPDDMSYPPSADLVYRNATTELSVLRTAMLNFPHCTELKVCGMQDRTGAFQIALGVVMIEQFQATLHCTQPSNTTFPLI